MFFYFEKIAEKHETFVINDKKNWNELKYKKVFPLHHHVLTNTCIECYIILYCVMCMPCAVKANLSFEMKKVIYLTQCPTGIMC